MVNFLLLRVADILTKEPDGFFYTCEHLPCGRINAFTSATQSIVMIWKNLNFPDMRGSGAVPGLTATPSGLFTVSLDHSGSSKII
jgi:hypothetical protein